MILTGGCLCGAVRYRFEGTPGAVVACHCRDCARTTGHHVVAVTVDAADVTVEETTLRWYASSEKGRRGFCAACGSNLFWKATDWNRMELWMGTVDAPTGLRLEGHEYIGSKSDYYEITDDLPKFDELAPESMGWR